MKYIKRLLIVHALWSPLVLLSGQFYTHKFPSIITPETEKRIILPFPYKELSDQDKKNTTLLLESRFIVLEKGSTRKALVGPLSPCHLIALTTGEKTVIFHYNIANTKKQLCEIARNIFKTEAPSMSKKAISGLVFANTTIPQEQATNLKKDQIVSIKKIKNTLVEKLHIKDSNQIQEIGFSFGVECNENNVEEYAKYMDHCELANRYILVDANMNIYCTSPRKENFFNTNVSNEPFFSPQKTALHAFCKKILKATVKNHIELQNENPNMMTLLDIDKFKKKPEGINVLGQEENSFEKPINLKEIKSIAQKENTLKESINRHERKNDRLSHLNFDLKQENFFSIISIIISIKKHKNSEDPASINSEHQHAQKNSVSK